MIDNLTLSLIQSMQVLPAELLSFITFIVCSVGLLGLMRYYGLYGLIAYQAMAVVIGNVQVLQITQFSTFNIPMSLGNVVFASTFLVSDILAEHYGADKAKKAVMISFWAQIWVTIFMVISLGHTPLIETTDPNLAKMADLNYKALMQIFTPSIRILIASLVAYMIAQFFDIWIIGAIKRLTGEGHVWVRQNLSMYLAGFVDNIIFTFLAWIVLSSTPVAMGTLWETYVFPSALFRIVISLLATPVIYLSYYTKHDKTY
jgi:uncharacterized integral membrane protein (TIGR00697 family)